MKMLQSLIENYLSNPGTCITYNQDSENIRVVTFPEQHLLIDKTSDAEIKRHIVNMMSFFQKWLEANGNESEGEREGIIYILGHMKNLLGAEIVELDLVSLEEKKR